VVDLFSVAVITVSVDENATAGVGGAEAASFAAEAAEDDGVDDAEAGAGEHGDGQLGDHGHVDGDAVAGFEFGEIAEHGGNFVHTFVELLIGDHYGWFVFRFGDENQSGFVLVFGEMAVNAIVAGVEFPADEPFPERRIGSVEGFAPGLVPIEETGVMVEASGKYFSPNFLTKAGSARLACVMNFLERAKVLFLLPMDSNLGFREFVLHFR